MPSNSPKPPPPKGPERSPYVVFARIRKVFEELGVLGSDLSLEYDGVRYRISCNEQAFVVYRVNDQSGARHHVPGWPVCLVSADTIFEECFSPGLSRDHYDCGVDLEKWLKIIDRHYRKNLPGV